ncbi:MAG: pantoate--beta-alanine ligase [Candidatus Marinimicrobia bacterium]|nr:pantoate--beta-alanine ligase [Candidatus Neomarinimicrobiota bacterium]
MKTFHLVSDCIAWRKNIVNTVGFVPTMGALHAGHVSLIKSSKKNCNKTLVSIYINPSQFSQEEDLGSYPKTIKEDLKILKGLNVDAVFLPSDNEIYPEDKPDNFTYENSLFKKLEGKSRPHFFYGVTKVVSRLFNIVSPTHTFFGEKDAQQSRIINQMIKDLNYNIRFISCPTVRSENGLALSSRNNYLSHSEQKQASVVYRGLKLVEENIKKGNVNVNQLKKVFTSMINKNQNIQIDYISIACNETLEELTIWSKNSLISVAIFYKNVRLIDNIVV